MGSIPVRDAMPYKDKTKKTENKRKRRVLSHLAVKNYLLHHSCIDCGETDVVVLQFDHKIDKKKNITDMIRHDYSVTSIFKEIEKCDIRCANCHMRKTANDFDWHYKIKYCEERDLFVLKEEYDEGTWEFR